ncbi:GTPase IMAP family member 7-like [Colletotrichum higginsianum]|nr:GTPase IMAP family member 7-like [Colletotrichum higginsianum]
MLEMGCELRITITAVKEDRLGVMDRSTVSGTRDIGECVRPLAKVAPLVALEVDVAREGLGAHVAAELGGLDAAAHLQEGRGRVAQLRVVVADVAVLVLVGGEAEGGVVAGVERAPVRPVVPGLVGVAVAAGVEAAVEEGAEGAVALVEVGAVVELDGVGADGGGGGGPDGGFDGGAVEGEGGVEAGDADLVAVLDGAALVGQDVLPEAVEGRVEGEAGVGRDAVEREVRVRRRVGRFEVLVVGGGEAVEGRGEGGDVVVSPELLGDGGGRM